MAQWPLVIAFQDPTESSTAPVIASLQALGWVDLTALGVILVFFVLGLFKGLIWQVSRILILVSAYFVAGQFGHDVAAMLGSPQPAQGPASIELGATGPAPVVPAVETTLYLSYCLLFVGVLIVLSLLAILIRKLAHKAGLGFFDRLGGGVLGIATGACVVLAGVFGVNMFFPQTDLARAAGDSYSLRYSQDAIKLLGERVNPDLRAVLKIDGTEGGQVAPPKDKSRPLMPTPLPLPGGNPPSAGSRERGKEQTGDVPPDRRRGG